MDAGSPAAERDLGRVAADADIGTLAPTLVGAAHLLFIEADGTPVATLNVKDYEDFVEYHGLQLITD